MVKSFEFTDGNRTFTCVAEPVGKAQAEAWWWFCVSTDAHHRYAPFRTSASDTKSSVQARIVAAYDEMLFKRSQPTVTPWQRQRAEKQAAAK